MHGTWALTVARVSNFVVASGWRAPLRCPKEIIHVQHARPLQIQDKGIRQQRPSNFYSFQLECNSFKGLYPAMYVFISDTNKVSCHRFQLTADRTSIQKVTWSSIECGEQPSVLARVIRSQKSMSNDLCILRHGRSSREALFGSYSIFRESRA